MNQQLNPASREHLRKHHLVRAWMAKYKEQLGYSLPDCPSCGWPHHTNLMCGVYSTFGVAWFGGKPCYVDTSNVEYLVSLTENVPHGFHWRDDMYVYRDGDEVVINYIARYNSHVSRKERRIPINEAASLVCAASLGGESNGRWQEAMEFLNSSANAAINGPAACSPPRRAPSNEDDVSAGSGATLPEGLSSAIVDCQRWKDATLFAGAVTVYVPIAALEKVCVAARAAQGMAEELARVKGERDKLAGAMRFILAFYEPGQTYLDTEAWKVAEAGARAALAALSKEQT